MATYGDRVPVESSATSYPREWRKYAMRRKLALFLLFGWVPECIGLFLLSRKWLHLPGLSLVLMAVWLLAAAGAVWWSGEFRCPRCRRRFGALGYKRTTNFSRGLFDKMCANCKLARFER